MNDHITNRYLTKKREKKRKDFAHDIERRKIWWLMYLRKI